MSELMNIEIERSLKILKRGGVILYPTDTVWGIGCDATRNRSVDRIYKIKRRPESKSLIVLLDRFEKIANYVKEVPEIARSLNESINTPLTIIYPKATNLARNLIASDGSIAIRIVKDEFCRQLIEQLDRPFVSTSANITGEATPLLFSKISPEITEAVDYIVDLHRNRINHLKPSTIIRLNEAGSYEIVRS